MAGSQKTTAHSTAGDGSAQLTAQHSGEEQLYNLFLAKTFPAHAVRTLEWVSTRTQPLMDR